MSLIREADQAFTITELGNLCVLEIPEDLATHENADSIKEVIAEDPISSTTIPKPSTPKVVSEQGMSALIADRKVYQTYFRSISLINLLLFFAIAVAFSFTLKFPGE